jgi:suppressor of fused protein SUFU
MRIWPSHTPPEHCDLGDLHVQVLWLIPIHESERAFAKARGLDALEGRFESTSFDYLDPFRPAVA